MGMLNWDWKVMRCLGKTEWEEGEEEFLLYIKETIPAYEVGAYSYRKKQIVRMPYGAT